MKKKKQKMKKRKIKKKILEKFKITGIIQQQNA